MFDSYTPDAGDELLVVESFSLDKDPARKTPQFQPGDAFDAHALGVSVFRVRGLLRAGRLELLRAPADEAHENTEEINEEINQAFQAPPAQGAADPEAAAD